MSISHRSSTGRLASGEFGRGLALRRRFIDTLTRVTMCFIDLGRIEAILVARKLVVFDPLDHGRHDS